MSFCCHYVPNECLVSDPTVECEHEHGRNTFPSLSPRETDLKRAFEMEYTSQFPDILLTTMDRYMVDTSSRYNNRSFSIVQSSGTGKSRLVDHSARSGFTFPFNLHEPMEHGCYYGRRPPNSRMPVLLRFFLAYPPCDNQVRDYLTHAFSNENQGLTKQTAFLEALFTLAHTQLETYTSGSPKDVAQTWYNWLKHDATSTTVGTNRASFYDKVVETATRVRLLSSAILICF